MNIPDRISAVLTESEQTALQDHVKAMWAMMPFLVNLTMHERRAILKMSARYRDMDEKCANLMATNPQLMPNFISAAEVDRDRQLRLILADLGRNLKALLEGVEDTVMQLEKEIVKADLAFYQSTLQASQHDVPGVDTVLDELKVAFPRTGKRKKKAATA